MERTNIWWLYDFPMVKTFINNVLAICLPSVFTKAKVCRCRTFKLRVSNEISSIFFSFAPAHHITLSLAPTCTCTRTQQCEPFESWKVLVSCVLTFFLIGFNWVAFPLFYVEFSERFVASKSVLGWVGSLQNAASQIVGLFVSAPVQMYGCRPVAVLGGVVLGVGTALSALSNTVGFLYFSYGIVSGE